LNKAPSGVELTLLHSEPYSKVKLQIFEL
jgi:hypothetical protein